MTQQQFYDKMINRLDKMIVAMNKLSKTLEAIYKTEEKQIDFLEKDLADIINE